MKKILFVDDEPNVLSGLKRMLRVQRKEWDMEFLPGGEEALKHLAEHGADVIVSDMRMPGMDGAALLSKVQEAFPSTIRIVLSGHAELEAALRAVSVAHQYLAKPCDSETIKEVVARACDLQRLLDEPRLRDMVGKVDSLPTIPEVYTQLVQLLADPDAGVVDAAEIVAKDAGITAKVLQVVNSSFFGFARSITGIRDATSCLGLNMLRNLTLSVEVFRSFDGAGKSGGFSLADAQKHANLTARIARKLLDDKIQAEHAFLGAMLHDVGRLVLISNMPEAFERVREAAAGRTESECAVEQDVLGVTHAEIGAYLLGIWGCRIPSSRPSRTTTCPRESSRRAASTLWAPSTSRTYSLTRRWRPKARKSSIRWTWTTSSRSAWRRSSTSGVTSHVKKRKATRRRPLEFETDEPNHEPAPSAQDSPCRR